MTQHKSIAVSSAEFTSDPGRYLQEAALGTTVSVTAPSGGNLVLMLVSPERTAEVVTFAEFVRHREEARDGHHPVPTLLEMVDFPPSYDVDFEPQQLTGSIFQAVDLR